MKVYVNGKLQSQEKAAIRVDDHGFLYGDGVYETLRVYDGRIFLLNEHLKRLKTSASAIALKPPIPYAKIEAAVYRTLKANRLKSAAVRITLSRGPGPYGFDPRPCKKPVLAITTIPFTTYPPILYQKGMKVAVVTIQRNHPNALPPWVKSTSCLNGVMAKIQSLKVGAHEAFLLTGEGNLAEGSISNIFVRKGRTLFTPALEGTLLAGVTRGRIIQLARKDGLQVRETRVPKDALWKADEVFITSTLMEVMPVTKIVFVDGMKMKTFPRVGPIALRLRDLLNSRP